MPPSAQAAMAEALQLAEQAVGLSDPNPRVGCVITAPDGMTVLGRGHTQAAGSAHAEVMALRDAQRQGHALSGATAHVTLEPCAHHGRTPPCCDALIAAGLGRVVVATGDPNPLVNGQGVARMRAAGLAVDWADDAAALASRELNIGFFSRMRRQRPWVRMKTAASLDGRTALPDGTSQWITGEAARRDGHQWRRRAGVVLTGVGTVLADDPLLDVRWVATALQPLRAVVDSQLRTTPSSRMLKQGGPVRLYHTASACGERAQALRAGGAILVCVPDRAGRADLTAVLDDLGRLPVNEVHVEAGAVLSGAMLQAGLVDELLVYQAPMLIGPGRHLADLPLRPALPEQPEWAYAEVARVGTDLRLRLRPRGRAEF